MYIVFWVIILSFLQEASEIAKACAIVAGNMFCVWKLHADIQVILYAPSYLTCPCNILQHIDKSRKK